MLTVVNLLPGPVLGTKSAPIIEWLWVYTCTHHELSSYHGDGEGGYNPNNSA